MEISQKSQTVGIIGKKKVVLGILIALVLGVVSGWGLSGVTSPSPLKPGEAGGKIVSGEGQSVKVGQKYGREDDIFKDWAEGVIEKNEGNGEGTHKLIREGGVSQTVYLNSSVLDLDMFVGHKIKVWGQTFSSEKVGWLMDVGKVEVLE